MANIATSDTESYIVPLKRIDERNMSVLNDCLRSFDKVYENLKIDRNSEFDILGYSCLDKQFGCLFRQQGFLYIFCSLNTTPLIKLTLKNKEKQEIAHTIAALKLICDFL